MCSRYRASKFFHLQTMKQFYFLAVFVTVLDQALSTGALRVNVIIVILGEDITYGYFATAPMFDLAMERSGKEYPGLMSTVSVDVLYQPRVIDCAEAGAAMMGIAGKLMDLVDKRNGLTALFAPGKKSLDYQAEQSAGC